MTYTYIENGGLWKVMSEDVYDEDKSIEFEQFNKKIPSFITLLRTIVNTIFCDYDNPELLEWLKSCDDLSIVYFTDVEIIKKLRNKDTSEEFVNFITYFDIVKLYNLPHFANKTYINNYVAVRGLNEYASCMITYKRLIRGNVIIRNSTRHYVNYDQLIQLEYDLLNILATYNMPSNNSVMLSIPIRRLCKFDKKIIHYMNINKYNWNSKNNDKFGRMNNKYSTCLNNMLELLYDYPFNGR